VVSGAGVPVAAGRAAVGERVRARRIEFSYERRTRSAEMRKSGTEFMAGAIDSRSFASLRMTNG
jgi:hypothetical protein